MNAVNWKEHIDSNPEICHGKACIKGTRIMVSVILANLAAGLSHEEIIASYPPLTSNDIHAALAYASQLSQDENMIPFRRATL